jgi:hypothetical protein
MIPASKSDHVLQTRGQQSPKHQAVQKVLKSIATYDSSANNGESIDEYCRKIRFQQSKLFAISNSNGVTSTVPATKTPVGSVPPVVMRNKSMNSPDKTTDKDKKRQSLNPLISEQNKVPVVKPLAAESKLGRSKSNLSSTRTENSASNRNLMLINDDSRSSFETSSKRWTSMYALRDSIRNLTACVSSKAKFPSAK